jgi:uncharacterized lipoprotein YajG
MEVNMNATKRNLVIGCMFLFVTTYGCAFGTRHIKLNPMKTSLTVDASGQSAFIEVIDKRDPLLKPIVGHVKNAYGMKTAQVVADKEVSIWIRGIIVEELRRSGASVITDAANLDNKTSKITVDVLVFYAQAYMRYGGEVTVALTVKKDNRDIIKEKNYTGQATLGMNWGASSESYQKVLELAMEEMLQKLIPDIITATKSTKLQVTPPEKPTISIPVASSPTTIVTVTWTFASIRSGAGNDYPVVTTAKQGDKLTVIGESGEWFSVQLENGQQGWISNRVVK